MSEKHSTPRVKRAPSLCQLEREQRAHQLFRWHSCQQYVECIVDGKRSFTLTARFPEPYLKRRGFATDSLWRPHGSAFDGIAIEASVLCRTYMPQRPRPMRASP